MNRRRPKKEQTMEIPEDSVAKVKRTLVRMAKQKKASLTGRELVRELAHEIHARLQDGHALNVIWFTIIADLPEAERMSFATFRKYWQCARLELGLTPLKSRTRPTVPAAKGPDRAPPLIAKAFVQGGTATDFRADPEDI